MSWPLPSPGEAMRAAVEAAQRGDVQLGSLWLGIAHELRVGAASSPARPFPRPLDDPPPIAKHVEHEDRLAETGVIRLPAPRPAYRDAQTEVILTDRPGDEILPRCGQPGCELRVELDLDRRPAIWVHALTSEPRCPASFDREPTYAMPVVDERG